MRTSSNQLRPGWSTIVARAMGTDFSELDAENAANSASRLSTVSDPVSSTGRAAAKVEVLTSRHLSATVINR